MKKNIGKRILSLALALVLVVGLLPMTALTAYAAPSEAETITADSTGKHAYSENLTVYYKHNNYLYKVVFSNIKDLDKVGLRFASSTSSKLQLAGARGVLLAPGSGTEDTVYISDFPTQTGSSVDFYLRSTSQYAVNKGKPVVTVTCVGVGDPTWSWNGTSSATAVFTSTDGNATITVGATITSSTQGATSCLDNDKITYTATATCNGQAYTTTKTVDGDVGPHSYTYSSLGNTITETCNNCSNHTATATLTASSQTYTGSAITAGASVDYSDGWAGSQEHGEITYSNNLNAGTATAKVTVEGKELTTTFEINEADISGAAVTLNPTSGTYNGTAYEPSVSVTFNGATLVKDTDYTVSWDKDGLTNADTYTATITGKGNFTGTKTAAFTIDPADIKGAVVTIDQNTFVYDGQPHKPTAIVTFNGDTLTEGVDYELYYLSSDQIMKWENGEPVKFFGTGKKNCDSINAGQYFAVVFGKGNFAANSHFAYAAYTIKQARNAWVTEPSISGWTYGEAANAPTAEAKFGTVYVLYDGTANDGTTYDGDTPPTKAGSYVARFFVDEAANYEPIGDGVEFIIAKADQAAPTGLTKTDTTYFGKADGKISGLTSAMEFRKEGASAYTAGFDGTLEYLAAGTYYVRYQGDANHNPSPDAVVTVNAGRKLQIVVPQNQVGYTVTVNKTEMEYEGSYTLKVEIHEGYTATEDFKIIISNWECGQQAGVEETYMNAIADQIIEVRGVADITPPAAEIKVKENKWTSFWNNLTFGLFFKETQDVTITVDDAGSGVKSIQYYLFDRELERDEVRSITDWIDYNGAFKINPDNRYVIYVKVTDNAGNVEYINSEGIVLDATAPVLYGIENGGVYHGDKVFKATDDYLKILKVDGVDVMAELNGDNEYKIIADNAEHTVTAIDEAGNVTEYKITVYKRYMVTYTDGEGSSYEKEFNYGEVITIPTNEIFNDTFRRGGYTLTGWQGYTEGMTMPLSPVTLTALYKPKQYTVSFNANGGETIEPITVTFDEKYGNLPSSAIAGLSGGNKNWYLIDAYGNVTETNIKNLTLVTTARDHTLFIKRNVLAPSISITLAVPGGISDGYQYYIPGASQRVLTATVGNTNTDILDYAYKWYKDGALIEGATSNVLTLDGNVSDSGTYKVEITATLKDGTNIVVASDTATASKEQKVKILHAANTISYDANGGEEGPQSSYTGGAALNISKDVPTRAHYDFIGWNTAPDGTGDSYKAEDAYIFVNDNGNGGCVVTLYAQWKLVEYTVTYTADGQIITTETVGHGKDANLPAVPAKNGYVGKWDSDGKNITGDTTITVVYTEIPVVKPNDVKPEDKTDLEDTKKQLEDMLKDDSYTDEDKKNIQDAIDDIDEALEVIGNVEAVEDLIDKLPENITKNDEDAIKAADDAYNALSDYEKFLVDEDAKKALDDAKAALAELNKTADTDSPQTGDNSNMFLWIALLFISGGAVITLTVVDRKRRMASKR